jgi:hypothetical protein
VVDLALAGWRPVTATLTEWITTSAELATSIHHASQNGFHGLVTNGAKITCSQCGGAVTLPSDPWHTALAARRIGLFTYRHRLDRHNFP